MPSGAEAECRRRGDAVGGSRARRPALPIRATVRLLNASAVAAAAIGRSGDRRGEGADQSGDQLCLPCGRGKYEFVFTIGRGGIHHGEFRLVGDDGSKFDDRRFFTMEIDQEIPVGLVRSKQEEIPYLDDAYYLAAGVFFREGRPRRGPSCP